MIPVQRRCAVESDEFKIDVELNKADQVIPVKAEHKDDEPRGLMLMVASLMLFSVTMLLNRVILQSESIDAVNLFMYSSIVQVAVSEALRRGVYKQPMKPLWDAPRGLLLICMRQSFSVLGWLAMTYLSSRLPIGYIQLNQNAIPVFTAVLGYFFLREVVTRIETIALLVCFAVITVTGISKTLFTYDPHGQYTLGNILLCIVSVFSFSVINIVGRLLKGFHYSVLCSAQFTLNVLFSLAVMLCISDEPYVPSSLRALALIASLGLSRSFSTLLFVRACQLAKSQRIATLNYAQALFGYTIDVLIYDYSLAFIEIVAILVVMGTGAITFIQTHKQAADAQQLPLDSQSVKEELMQPLLNPALWSQQAQQSSANSRSSDNRPYKDWPGLKYKVIQ